MKVPFDAPKLLQLKEGNTGERLTHLWERRRCSNRRRAFWLARGSRRNWPSGSPSSPRSRLAPADPRCFRLTQTLFPELQRKNQRRRKSWPSTVRVCLNSSLMWPQYRPVQMSVWFLPHDTNWTFSDFRAEILTNKSTFIVTKLRLHEYF